MSSPLIVEYKEILSGAAFKSAAKDENLNESVPLKEHSTRIGKTIWWLKIGTYLYTPVTCVRVLYFGTADKSGDLYAVEAKNGEVIFKFKTSGT